MFLINPRFKLGLFHLLVMTIRVSVSSNGLKNIPTFYRIEELVTFHCFRNPYR